MDYISFEYSGQSFQKVSEEFALSSGVPAEVYAEKLAEAKTAEIMKNRQSAYESESDPYFLEALRKEAAGDEDGADTARTTGLSAIEDIKARYPI